MTRLLLAASLFFSTIASVALTTDQDVLFASNVNGQQLFTPLRQAATPDVKQGPSIPIGPRPARVASRATADESLAATSKSQRTSRYLRRHESRTIFCRR